MLLFGVFQPTFFNKHDRKNSLVWCVGNASTRIQRKGNGDMIKRLEGYSGQLQKKNEFLDEWTQLCCVDDDFELKDMVSSCVWSEQNDQWKIF